MILHDITIDKNQIEIFCKKWKIKEFSLFGSVIREDFMPDSDVDVLVSFTADAHWSL
jgi:predicted nucleotidyltransferase